MIDSKKEISVGPVEIFSEKMTPSVIKATPKAPNPSQRFKDSPGINKKRRYCWNSLLVSALSARIMFLHRECYTSF